MPSLSREYRKLLENTVAQARQIAEEGARKVLRDQYAVEAREAWSHMTSEDRELRNQLRAHARQLGDKRDSRTEVQESRHLVEATAYEHWHRMLFARFLAENDLLLDSKHGVPMTLDEVQELAREQHRDWMDIAAELAQPMLLSVFQPDDPVLKVQLPPETRQQLEEKLEVLPREIFLADDSLGWVYQFWQKDEKERVNKSEVKIGADELPAVTQLFTEDYMVLFLLENTLGAWWTAKRRAEGKDPELPGHEWTYLRLNEDGSPAAGSFDGWPRSAKELKVLDPCMGSGHFLVFALPILARMRMEEEGLSLRDALAAVLRDNLFGLEIDARCSQIAAFNLALAAWRLAGEHFVLPELQLACSGLGPNCTKEQWMKLAEDVAAGGGMPAKMGLFGSENTLLSEPARNAMEALYELFSQAPVLGSLVDPANLRRHLFEADYQAVAKLFAGVLSAQSGDENTRETLVAAAGMAQAGALLAGKYTLVITNVPYLGRGRQELLLREYCERFYAEAAADLAACFINRCLRFCSLKGSISIVTKQEPLFLKQYKDQRLKLIESFKWNLVARLGPRAFETISGERVTVCLLGLTNRIPTSTDRFFGLDAGIFSKPDQKASFLSKGEFTIVNQADQLRNPDVRIVIEGTTTSAQLKEFATALAGHADGDSCRFEREFWEVDRNGEDWEFLQSTVDTTTPYGGRSSIILWENEAGQMRELAMSVRHLNHIAQNWLRGKPNWGKKGVVISQIGSLPTTLYSGQIYDCNCCAIVPNEESNLPAVWAYCSSEEFAQSVRKLDQKMNVAPHTLLKVPFDVEYWRQVSEECNPDGLPTPSSNDPTQWLFNGHPKSSGSTLQVAVARLIGYRWPRQTGSSFLDCPVLSQDGLEKHAEVDGIVPLNAIAGESPAADRLRALLADAYGGEWSVAKLRELLRKWDSLEEWLRDGFFEEHCDIFHQRPFIWHVWDGRKDGFHALVNYHKLTAPNGRARQTLEKLIYTWLGRWIDRQNEEVRAGKEGADARLTAALHLKAELEKILAGEKPYDIFVRWKPLDEQPIGWEPDINDGVRLNIRPWLTTTLAPSTKPKKDACILRVTPKIKYGRDRGTEPHRKKEDFPWFWSWDPEKADPTKDFFGNGEFDGARWNDLHYSLTAKRDARAKKSDAAQKEVSVSGAQGRITE